MDVAISTSLICDDDASVYAVCAGDMGWEEDECYFVANSFKECLSQPKHWDE